MQTFAERTKVRMDGADGPILSTPSGLGQRRFSRSSVMLQLSLSKRRYTETQWERASLPSKAGGCLTRVPRHGRDGVDESARTET